MVKYDLPGAARELEKGIFELAGMVNREELDCVKEKGSIFFPEESVLEYKLRETDKGSKDDFLKLTSIYRHDKEELERLVGLALERGEYKWLFVPALEQFEPEERLIKEGEYEFLCDFFEDDEEKYKKMAARFVEDEPGRAMLYGLRREDMDLIMKGLEEIKDAGEAIDIYLEAGELKPELKPEIAGLFYDLIKEVLEEDIEKLKEEAGRLGINVPYILKRKRSAANQKKREIIRTAKMLRAKVERRFGIKLPEKVRLSSPQGSYASIKYQRYSNNAANAFA